MSNYHYNLCQAMRMLAERDNAIFLGQGVGNRGTSMSDTFDRVPDEKRLEMPVAEDMQMGMAIGMAIGGYLPICVFPRWNFLICATNQIVNHLDRLQIYSDGGYRPKVIIRTAVPSSHPFNPGPQHDDDFTRAFRSMCRTLEIVTLDDETSIIREYRKAIERDGSTLLIEFTDRYKDERGKRAA